MKNICEICNHNIQIMCRKGTGICGELCEKESNGRRPGDAATQSNIEGDLSQLEDTYESHGGVKHEFAIASESAA